MLHLRIEVGFSLGYWLLDDPVVEQKVSAAGKRVYDRYAKAARSALDVVFNSRRLIVGRSQDYPWSFIEWFLKGYGYQLTRGGVIAGVNRQLARVVVAVDCGLGQSSTRIINRCGCYSGGHFTINGRYVASGSNVSGEGYVVIKDGLFGECYQ